VSLNHKIDYNAQISDIQNLENNQNHIFCVTTNSSASASVSASASASASTSASASVSISVNSCIGTGV
jgi:hypothetical protein